MTMTIDGSLGVTFNDTSLQPAAASPYVLKNKIINGAMVIDQRNAGAATANTINGYTVDRWGVFQSTTGKVIAQQNAGSVTPPTGFSNYLGMTSQSAYSVAAGDFYFTEQRIEGFNFADLNWGTANAQTVTLSFWVRSSLTGTFGGALVNRLENRSYPFTYTISTANTWEKKSVTIAGDTTGTWDGATNDVGLRLRLGFGAGSTYSGTSGAWAAANYVSATGATSVVGTNGATFYITGVQLEQNTVATPFERRLYDKELISCQRYYETTLTVAPADNMSIIQTGALAPSDGSSVAVFSYQVIKRTTPTAVIYSPLTTSPSGKIRNGNTSAITSIGGTLITASAMAFATGTTASNYVQFGYAISAEL